MVGTILYGTREIRYEILAVPRKTLEIAVHPDARVVVKAPCGTSREEVEKRLTRRARWIVSQLVYFEQFNPRTAERKFLSGETHLYLGRRYRLKVQRGDADSVKLTRGLLLITTRQDGTPEKVRRLLTDWYLTRARERFADALRRCQAKLPQEDCPSPDLKIRRMKTRWGSLSPGGILTLNIELIRAPQACIDYVITHELCHLEHKHHGPQFYQRLEAVMPDWQKRKHLLEVSLV